MNVLLYNFTQESDEVAVIRWEPGKDFNSLISLATKVTQESEGAAFLCLSREGDYLKTELVEGDEAEAFIRQHEDHAVPYEGGILFFESVALQWNGMESRFELVFTFKDNIGNIFRNIN